MSAGQHPRPRAANDSTGARIFVAKNAVDTFADGPAREKIVADLAFLLSLPCPGVRIWEEAADGITRAMVAWPGDGTINWRQAHSALSKGEFAAAMQQIAAMLPFYAWLGLGDRHADNVVVTQVAGDVRLSFIDHDEFSPHGGTIGPPEQYFTDGDDLYPPLEMLPIALECVGRIESLNFEQVDAVIRRIPGHLLEGEWKDRMMSALRLRRDNLSTAFRGALAQRELRFVPGVPAF